MAKKKQRRSARPRAKHPGTPSAPKRNWFLVALFALAGAVIALTAALVTRGGGGGDSSGFLAPSDPGPLHVHGLGINPADQALFIATHTGTYRVAPDSERAERVGDSRQDTMGFTIVGPNRFLGSGHPDPQAMRTQNLPPNLGLIESRDGGRTWTSVSLLGEADFHVLRSRANRVYAYDSTNGRLLVSRDGGRTWSRRPTPGRLIDLVVSPQRQSHLVAATDRGVIESTDDARSWRAASDDAGLLAWPAPRRLLLVDGAGQVHLSVDSGDSWSVIGEIGGQPAAFLAHTPRELYAALHDGTVKRSVDGGGSWAIRSVP